MFQKKEKVVKTKAVETRSTGESRKFFIDIFINYLKPSIYLKSIKDIDTDALQKQGKKLIVCDLDNTLVPHFTKFPTKDAFNFVDRVKKSGIQFILVSNNTDARVSFFAEKLGLKDYIAGAKKPFPKKIKKKMEELKYKPEETIMIGDMIIMDMVAANLMKVDTVLVSPLIDAEKTWSRILAWIEKRIFKRLERKNLLATNEDSKRALYGEEYETL